MKRANGVQLIIKALERAVNEHGWPNSFSPRELQEYGAALDYTLVGRWSRPVIAALTDQGWTISYVARRFEITYIRQRGG
jgi:hypothetical protein